MNKNKFDLLLQALQIPGSQRNQKHLQDIEDYLLQIPYFEKLQRKNYIKQLNQCWRCVNYLKLNKGETVFYKGAWPKEFYIILKGYVNILIPKDGETISQFREKNKRLCQVIDAKIRQFEIKKSMIQGFESMSKRQRKFTLCQKDIQKYIQQFQTENQGIQQVSETDSDSIQEDQQTNRELGGSVNQILNRQRTSKVSVCNWLIPQSIKRNNPQSPKQSQFFSEQDLDDINLFDYKISELDNQITIGDLDQPDKYFDSGVFKYVSINVLTNNQTFGQQSLLLLQGRSATVICSQDTHFVTISKEDYDKVLSEIEQIKLQLKVALNLNQLFQQSRFIENALQVRIPYNNLINLTNSFYKIKLMRNSFLFFEGDSPQDVYLLKKGEAQILKISNKFKKNYEQMNEVDKFEQLHKKCGLNFDPLIKVFSLTEGFMVGHQDLILRRQRQFSVQVISSEATFYFTDKYQFNLALSDLQHCKNAFVRQISKLDLIIQKNYLKFDQTQGQSIKKSLNKKHNKKAGALRTSVKDIDYYFGQDVPQNEKKSLIEKVSVRKMNETYGATILDKIEKFEQLIKKAYMPQAMNNDEYIQAFDKAGIEKRIKKLKLRKKILSKGMKFKELNNDVKQQITKVISTRDRIKLKKDIESGKYRQQYAKEKLKNNLSWCEIISQQYKQVSQEQYELFNLNYSFDENDIEWEIPDFLKKQLRTSSPNKTKSQTPNSFQRTTFLYSPKLFKRQDESNKINNEDNRPKTALDKQIKEKPKLRIQTALINNKQYYLQCQSSRSTVIQSTRRNQNTQRISTARKQAELKPIVISEMIPEPNPLFVYSNREEKIEFNFYQPHSPLSGQNDRPQSAMQNNKKVMKSAHNQFRFNSPHNVQIGVLARRFNKKK